MSVAMSTNCNIRPAEANDIPAIRDIFSYYVLNTALSFRVNDPTEPFMLQRFNATIASGLPYVVATVPSIEVKELVVGYAHASSFQAGKHAYGHSVEITIFLHQSHTRQGIGSALMADLLSRLKTCRHVSIEPGFEDEPREFQVRKVFAIMGVDENQEGEGLALRDWYLNKWGFEECGRFKGSGQKLGKQSIDTLYLEKHLQ